MCVLLERGVNIDVQSQEFPGNVYAHTWALGSHLSLIYSPLPPRPGCISRSGKGKRGQGILVPLEWNLRRTWQTVKASGVGTWGDVPLSSGEQEHWSGKQAKSPPLWTRKALLVIRNKGFLVRTQHPTHTKAGILITHPIFLWVITCDPLGFLHLYWLRIRQSWVLRVNTLWLCLGKA